MVASVRSGDVRHFTADFAVENGAPHPVGMFDVVGAGVAAAEIYRLFFHGRSFQVLEQASYSPAAMIGRLALDLPPVTEPMAFDLIETQTFASRVIFERYRRARDA